MPTTILLDREFLWTLVQFLVPEFSHLNPLDYSKKEIMMKFVQEFGPILCFANNTLKKDREIVLHATRKSINYYAQDVTFENIQILIRRLF